MVFLNFTFHFLTEMWEFKNLNYPENARLFLGVENMCIVTKLYKQRWNVAHCTKNHYKKLVQVAELWNIKCIYKNEYLNILKKKKTHISILWNDG